MSSLLFFSRYMYTGTLDLKEKSGLDILDLLLASDELLLDESITFLQEYLIVKQTKWLHENLVTVLNTIFLLESCKKLQDDCLRTICDDPEPFFNSPNSLL